MDEVREVRGRHTRRDPGQARRLHAVAAGRLGKVVGLVGVRPDERFHLRDRTLGGRQDRLGGSARPVVHADRGVADGRRDRPVVRRRREDEVAYVVGQECLAEPAHRHPFAGRGEDERPVGGDRHADTRRGGRDERVAVIGSIERDPPADPRDPAIRIDDPVRPREQPVRAGQRAAERGGVGDPHPDRPALPEDPAERDHDRLVGNGRLDRVALDRHRAEFHRPEAGRDRVQLHPVDRAAGVVSDGHRRVDLERPRPEVERQCDVVLRGQGHAGSVDGAGDQTRERADDWATTGRVARGQRRARAREQSGRWCRLKGRGGRRRHDLGRPRSRCGKRRDDDQDDQGQRGGGIGEAAGTAHRVDRTSAHRNRRPTKGRPCDGTCVD